MLFAIIFQFNPTVIATLPSPGTLESLRCSNFRVWWRENNNWRQIFGENWKICRLLQIGFIWYLSRAKLVWIASRAYSQSQSGLFLLKTQSFSPLFKTQSFSPLFKTQRFWDFFQKYVSGSARLSWQDTLHKPNFNVLMLLSMDSRYNRWF